jgi:hypothetical protein
MYAITRQVYPDSQFNYDSILTINTIPEGPLSNYTKQINISPKRISAFQSRSSTQCVYALCNPSNNELLTLNDLPVFFTYCLANGYTINTDITKMLNAQMQTNPVICYISYNI